MSFQNKRSQNSRIQTGLAPRGALTRGETYQGDTGDSLKSALPEILFITTYPPRECGIATYSQDLIKAIEEKFGSCFSLKVCALEAEGESLNYPEEVKYVLPSCDVWAYEELAAKLNLDPNLCLIFVQHEFGLFSGEYGQYLLDLLCLLKKPVITTFHTILPSPEEARKKIVHAIALNSVAIVAMTRNGAAILEHEYDIPANKISLIAHGTHLVSPFDHTEKAARNHLGNRIVLTTFGLLSPGKSIETALYALPAIVERFPNVLYLIIGKTHPGITKRDGEQYREKLQQIVLDLHLQGHVRFINRYLSLDELLGYLQRTDIYLFTSKDPYQIVSGTFAYAMGCGCPVISTPIPHAKELLQGAGVIVNFQQPDQLAEVAVKLLADPDLMREMKLNALHKIRPTAWPNAAIAHVDLVVKNADTKDIHLQFSLPKLSLSHIRKMTTDEGIIQFSKLSAPDLLSGYTLDDNARALIAMCRYYKITGESTALPLIEKYLTFIVRCLRVDGRFLNYVNADGTFHEKNQDENLEDANGRAAWALGEFLSYGRLFDSHWAREAELALLQSLRYLVSMKSPRAKSFVLKGLHYYDQVRRSTIIKQHILSLAGDLVARYNDVSEKKWKWFEEYMTYANGVIPEALLCAYMSTGNETFKAIAKSSFDFLLGVIFHGDEIKVISNQGWLQKGNTSHPFGEQPVDVAYTIMALDKFHAVFPYEGYREKIEQSMNWFLGKNHLRQIMYNPVTGGCYDGLEEDHVNLNQGAESTVSYLLSRLVMQENLECQPANLKSNLKLLGEAAFM
jgi:glycosyltransferase involved in cell wall biosynthesis